MKTNKNVVKVISGVLSTSMLVASCTQYLPPEESVYGNIITDNSELGQVAVPISIKLKPEDVQYIKAIQKISNDIIKSPQKAKEFNQNPKSILRQYGYNGDINLDDSMLKMTMALADTDIYEAIKNKDFKRFVNQCMDKGLMSSNTILSNDFYKDQLETLYQDENFKKYIEQIDTNGTLRSDVGAWSPVLVSFLAVAVGVVVVIASLFWIAINENVNSYQELNTVDIYSLRSGMENTHIVVNDYIEGMTNDAISIINTRTPEYFQSHSETEARNLIKVNIINNL